MSEKIKTAFVLGAGLGTRLRPLTEKRPKPLVPLFNKPLITFAFDHLIAAGIHRFVVNTHHRPEAYSTLLGEKGGQCVYRNCPVNFCHEPLLLETGGGIKNASKLIGDEPFIVYNGDVLADIPLAELISAHANGNRIATLALRSEGAERRIQCDLQKGVITDMRGILGGRTEPSFLFTGISVFSPEIFDHIPQGEIISIIPVLAELLRAGKEIGGALIDEGAWFDIGNVEAYIEAHAILAAKKHTLSYLPDDWIVPVDPTAIVKHDVRFSGFTSIGAGATIGEDACLQDVIVWPGASVEPYAHLQKRVVI